MFWFLVPGVLVSDAGFLSLGSEIPAPGAEISSPGAGFPAPSAGSFSSWSRGCKA